MLSENPNPTPKDSLTLYKVLQLQASIYYNDKNYTAALPIFNEFVEAAQQYERIAKQDLKAKYSFDNMLQAASLYKKANDFENAIRAYLFIAENYPDKDKKTQIIPAYYNAAVIVDSFLMDYEREISIYQKIVDRYPNTEDSRDAEIQIIFVYENKLGDKETAANKYIELAKKYKEWPKAPEMFTNAIVNYDIDMDKWNKAEDIALLIRKKFPEQEGIVGGVTRAILDKIEVTIDSLYENENYTELSNAIKEYYNKDKYFRDKGIKLNLKPQYAKLKFYEGEIIFNDVMQDTVIKTISRRKWNKEVKRIVDKRKKANQIYLSLKDYNIPKFTTAGLHRLGQIDEHLFYTFNIAIERFSQVYKDPIKGDAFLMGMSEGLVEPIYNSMIGYFSANYKILEDSKLENEWTLASRDKLYEYGILQKPEEGYEYITIVTDTNWTYSNTYQDGFSKLDFVDSLSLFTSPNTVSLEKLDIDTLSVDVDTTSQFIWGVDTDTTLYFRNVFEIHGVPEIARLTLVSPNRVLVFINGKIYNELFFLENEKDWQMGKSKDITDKLITGKNVIVFQAMCDTNSVYKGLLANLKITSNLSAVQESEQVSQAEVEESELEVIPVDTTYYTNNEWLVSTEVEQGWFDLVYNDSLWSGSAVIPYDSLSSLPEFVNSKVIWDSLLSDTVYFRYKFTAPDSIEFAELKIAVDTVFSIYVNGKDIAINEINFKVAGKYQPRIYEITNSVSTGMNVIAIKAVANRLSLGMIAEIHIVGILKKHAFLMNSILGVIIIVLFIHFLPNVNLVWSQDKEASSTPEEIKKDTTSSTSKKVSAPRSSEIPKPKALVSLPRTEVRPIGDTFAPDIEKLLDKSLKIKK